MSTRVLRCPSCDGAMQEVDKHTVVVDICRDCRGVFLDRGELDRLLDEAGRREDISGADRAERPGRRSRGSDEGHQGQEGRGGRRKRGWLEDIFELGG